MCKGLMNQVWILLHVDRKRYPLNVMKTTSSHDSRWHCARDFSHAFLVIKDDDNYFSCCTSSHKHLGYQSR